MTKREKQIFNVVKELGTAHAGNISEGVGLSPDYVEQICRDMIWLGYLVKKGRYYKIAG